MRYRFRVTLTGIKGFYRVYELDDTMTLYTFHKQMRSDMEFPQDQLILFKALNADGEVCGRFGLFDLGYGTVDQITVAQVVKEGVTSFVYFYDVTNKKSVNIAIEGEVEAPAKEKLVSPTIVDTKGPNPIEFENGYVAYEDLPDDQRHLPGERPAWIFGGSDDDEDLDDEDDDISDDDEDSDDEDGKEIYGGEEI